MATFDLAYSSRNLGLLRMADKETEIGLRGVLHLASF